MTTADDAAMVDLYWRTTGDNWAIPEEVMVKFARAVLAWQREQRPDATQREAVARALFGPDWDGPYEDGSYLPRSPIGRAYAHADAALAALAPVQPDPLRAGVEALLAAAAVPSRRAHLSLTGIETRLRALLAETEVPR